MVKVGLAPLRDAVSETLALPPVPLVSQTTMAYCTVLSGFTVPLPPRFCTLRHSVAVGGGELVLVGVGVAVGVGVGLAVGVLFVPPGEIVGVPDPGVLMPLDPGPGVASGVGVTRPPSGVGFGVTGVKLG
jgi:hypothetical protein